MGVVFIPVQGNVPYCVPYLLQRKWLTYYPNLSPCTHMHTSSSDVSVSSASSQDLASLSSSASPSSTSSSSSSPPSPSSPSSPSPILCSSSSSTSYATCTPYTTQHIQRPCNRTSGSVSSSLERSEYALSSDSLSSSSENAAAGYEGK